MTLSDNSLVKVKNNHKSRVKPLPSVLLSSLRLLSQPPSGPFPHTLLRLTTWSADNLSLTSCASVIEVKQTVKQDGNWAVVDSTSSTYQWLTYQKAFSRHFYLMVLWNIFIDSSFALEEVLVYRMWAVVGFKSKYESGLSLPYYMAVVACNIKCVSCGFETL